MKTVTNTLPAAAPVSRNQTACEAIRGFVDALGAEPAPADVASSLVATATGEVGIERARCLLASTWSRRLEPSDGGEFPAIPVDGDFGRWLCRLEKPAAMERRPGGADAGGTAVRALAAELPRVVPLRSNDGLLGALFYGAKRGGAPLDDEDSALLETVSRLAAFALADAFRRATLRAAGEELGRFAAEKARLLDRAGCELEAPLSVLRSALWSIETERIEEGLLVDMSRDAVGRLRGKVDQLASLNGIGRDGAPPDLRPVDLGDLVDDCLRELVAEFEAKGLSVEVANGAEALRPHVDEEKMRTVLRNVVEAVVRAAPRGGVVRVSIELDDEAPNGEGNGAEGAGPPEARFGPVEPLPVEL